MLHHFPHVVYQDFAPYHERLWEWFESLTPGSSPRPRVEIWSRDHGKSTNLELGAARLAVTGKRSFVLIVSGTQDQADKHVAAIASLLERIGIPRALNVYGSAKGWRRQELRTASGFNVAGFGLDTELRGVKLDEFRPDLIVADDLDSRKDSAKAVEKKIATLTTTIIPAGSANCAHLFLQNMIHEEGIFAQLADGRADFLMTREVFVEPAIHGFRYALEEQGEGPNLWRITAGKPSWPARTIADLEKDLNEWGLNAFLREAQHDVASTAGYVFNVGMFRQTPPGDLPPLKSACLAWDLAATEGGGDWTVGVLMARGADDLFYVLGVIRGQWSSERVRACIRQATDHYRAMFPAMKLRLPQDPGQAGVSQAVQFRQAFEGALIRPVTGDKATRASGFAEAVNLGNVVLVQSDLPEFLRSGPQPLVETLQWQGWHRSFREVLRKFREDETDQLDDDVDAAADAFNELRKPAKVYGAG